MHPAGIESPLVGRHQCRHVEPQADIFFDRLHVSCGSRGDARPDSDIDVVAVLDKLAGDYGDELERGLAAVYPVALRLGRRVSVKPLARDEYEQGDSPLLRELRRSGVAA